MKKIGCDGKIAYKKRMAIMTASNMNKYDKHAHIYKCQYGNHYHVTTMNHVQSLLSVKLINTKLSKRRKILELLNKANRLNYY